MAEGPPASPQVPESRALGRSLGDPRRALPAVGRLLKHPDWPADMPEAQRAAALRPVLARARALAAAESAAPEGSGEAPRGPGTTFSPESPTALSQEALATSFVAQALAEVKPWPRRRKVLNATGVLLHTNLGRAPLAPVALEAIAELGGAFFDLELDLEEGRRGSRHDVAEALLCALTGAEAALVVNNGAAAVLLAATALAKGRELVTSRGELVAIGGGFRVHEVLASAGAKLVEVGATNRTTAEDYRKACGPDTVALWRTHRSNFRMEGFVEELGREALVALAHELGLWAIEDLGHGLLAPLPQAWGTREATLGQALGSGMDLVIASGDKLLGGPQAGLVLGKAELVAQLAKHPLMRALRPDKLSLLALEATLRLWAKPQEAAQQLPQLRLAQRSPEAFRAFGDRLLAQAQPLLPDWRLKLVPSVGAMGGGTLPGTAIPSMGLHLHRPGQDPQALALALRRGNPAVLGRLEGSALMLDLLALEEDESAALLAALQAAAAMVP